MATPVAADPQRVHNRERLGGRRSRWGAFELPMKNP